MDKVCFGVINYFKYWNRWICFKYIINLFVKIFVELLFYVCENDFFRFLEDEIYL